MKILPIIGCPGAGKGTQVDLLSEKIEFDVIRTGELLREKAKKNDFIGKKIQQTLNQGGLIPTPIVFSLWMPKLEELSKSNAKGVIFDGNPRKLYEAYMLEEVFEMFSWHDFRACYINISKEEALSRLEKRKRHDDSDARERLSWFETEVIPVIDYYREKGALIEINGEQSIEMVQRELYEKLNDFLYGAN